MDIMVTLAYVVLVDKRIKESEQGVEEAHHLRGTRYQSVGGAGYQLEVQGACPSENSQRNALDGAVKAKNPHLDRLHLFAHGCEANYVHEHNGHILVGAGEAAAGGSFRLLI